MRWVVVGVLGNGAKDMEVVEADTPEEAYSTATDGSFLTCVVGVYSVADAYDALTEVQSRAGMCNHGNGSLVSYCKYRKIVRCAQCGVEFAPVN